MALSAYATIRTAPSDAEKAEWETLVERIHAHDLKNGWWVADDKSGLPGQVSDLKMSKTGKHGHAKFTYKLTIPFSGKTSNPMHPGGDSVYKCSMTKNEWDLLDCEDEEHEVKVQPGDDSKYPDGLYLKCEPELYEQIKDVFTEGEKIVVILVHSGPQYKSNGEIEMIDLVTGFKTE